MNKKSRKKPLWKVLAHKILPKKYEWQVQQFTEKYLGRIVRLLGSDLDFFYGEDFAKCEFRNKAWVEDYCDIVLKIFNPDSVIDFGCGTGDILAPFEKKGIDILGVDGSKACMRHSNIDKAKFVLFDLRQEYRSTKKYDLCLCLEVAEHIEEKYCDVFIGNLTQSSPTIIFTAASPGQSGRRHVNLKPCEWWIKKFQSYDFKFDECLTNSVKEEIENIAGVQKWYTDNLMIFGEKQK